VKDNRSDSVAESSAKACYFPVPAMTKGTGRDPKETPGMLACHGSLDERSKTIVSVIGDRAQNIWKRNDVMQMQLGGKSTATYLLIPPFLFPKLDAC